MQDYTGSTWTTVLYTLSKLSTVSSKLSANLWLSKVDILPSTLIVIKTKYWLPTGVDTISEIFFISL